MRRRFLGQTAEPIDVNKYLTMMSLEDDFVVSFYNPTNNRTLYYCIDGDGVWRTLKSNTSANVSTDQGYFTESIPAGSTISFKGIFNNVDQTNGMGNFMTTGKFELYGNAMSLIKNKGVSINDSSDNQFSTYNYAFARLFYNTKVTYVSENFLPATTLSTGCYKEMFYGCSLLTTPPKLPATTLTQYCYYGMFQNCTSLTESPILPAGTLVSQCYYYMFRGCSKLKKITMLATSFGSASDPLYYWVYGVASSGTFIQSLSFEYQGTLSVGVSGIPSGWVHNGYSFNIDSYTNDWRESTTVPNPDPDKYWGVYESVGNYNANSKSVCMNISFSGLDTLKLYIRSNAESIYDYVMVTQPDQWVNHATSQNSNTYSNTSLIKAHTSGAQNSGTALSNYKLVEFTGLNYESHTIQVIYRKDSSAHSGTDRGYVIIPKYGPTTFSQTSGGYL